MTSETHINNIIWDTTDMRLADLYKLFLWDYNSKKHFYLEIDKIIEKRHIKIKAKHDVDIAKKYRED